VNTDYREEYPYLYEAHLYSREESVCDSSSATERAGACRAAGSMMRVRKRIYMGKKAGRYGCLLLCLLLLLTGCGRDEKIKIVLTNGFDRDEIFRIESTSCHLPEAMVYLINTQTRYEAIYGSRLWEKSLRGKSLEQNVKDGVLADLAQIKVMNLLAEKNGVELTEGEMELAAQAGQAYMASLDETVAEKMGIDEKTVAAMYREYAVADKVYRYIIKDINPEISDDEARTITVEHILIKTYSLDGSGQRSPYTPQQKEEARKRAREALREIQGGADFESVASKYNEDNKSIYSFGKGEMEPTFEKAAFNLGTGEISDIVETDYGYHIIKCISTFNREETDANKVKIVEQRRKEVFGQEYDRFVDSLTRNMNEEVWESVSFLEGEKLTDADFFQIYRAYFDGTFGE